MRERCDVAIIGAGPAGSLAAYRLARGGARVTLVDGSHPREKPCGGGVTGRALAVVQDVLRGRHLPAASIRTARFMNVMANQPASNGSDPVVSLPGGALIVVSRESFDGALLAAACDAGVRLEAVRARDVVAAADGVVVTTDHGSIRTPMLVGADGVNSLVRRRLGRAFTRAQLSVATGFFARGATSDEIAIEMMDEPEGYLWSFPRPDHLAIGACAQADAASAPTLRTTAAAWIERSGIGRGARLEPYSWPIPSLFAADFDGDRIGGMRWALIGDAAGLVDPITREGIFFALKSGEWIADALLTNRGQSEYETRARDEAIPELARAARLKRAFFQPAFAALLRRALRDSAAIRSVMADLVAGRQSYASLKWRLLKTLELGLAWRTLRAAVD